MEERIESVFMVQEQFVTGGVIMIFKDFHVAKKWLSDLHDGTTKKFEEHQHCCELYILSESVTNQGLQEPEWHLVGEIVEMDLNREA